jgi:uncharacterized protein (TIGR03067 family)
MRRALPVFAALSLAFAPLPFPKPVPGDLKAMQGEWEAVTYKVSVNSKNASGVLRFDCPDMRLAFSGGLLRLSQGGAVIERAPFRLDRSRSPGAIDIGGPDGGARVGVYKMEGDTLTICDAPDAVGRPSGFTGDGPLQRLIVLRRKRP